MVLKAQPLLFISSPFCLLWEIEVSFNEFVFSTQESLAFMFEMAHLHEDALREYDELELCYLETGAQCQCLD